MQWALERVCFYGKQTRAFSLLQRASTSKEDFIKLKPFLPSGGFLGE